MTSITITFDDCSPETAYNLLRIPELSNSPDLIAQLEDLISTEAVYSVWYAMYRLKGRFEKGEAIIAKSAPYSVQYASIIRCRFELGEPAIARDIYYSYQYDELLIRFGINNKNLGDL